MKRMLAAALALVAGAALAEPLAPDALVMDVMLDIQRFIVTDKDLQEGDRAKTIRLIEDKALPHFNHVGMTALAVGVHWRKATPEQKKRLADAF
ncbi:MAG: ABC transporter substrate-binding protein, partial [Betaproteobacteria bacterium]|nr:ABC transporter substrate-binding protein [Betaproteobacteria bacterium]